MNETGNKWKFLLPLSIAFECFSARTSNLLSCTSTLRCTSRSFCLSRSRSRSRSLSFSHSHCVTHCLSLSHCRSSSPTHHRLNLSYRLVWRGGGWEGERESRREGGRVGGREGGRRGLRAWRYTGKVRESIRRHQGQGMLFFSARGALLKPTLFLALMSSERGDIGLTATGNTASGHLRPSWECPEAVDVLQHPKEYARPHDASAKKMLLSTIAFSSSSPPHS
jgi:hypothetical protein